MDFVINPLTEAECKYTYAQSTQIDGQTGCCLLYTSRCV